MKTILVLSIVSLLNISCDTNSGDSYPYNPPVYANDGLEVGTLEEVRIDSQAILKASERIHQGRHGEVHSMLIYKDNMLVFEEYFEGYKYKWDAPEYKGEHVNWNMDMPHNMMSVTKSFTSACVGIALDLGYMDNVNQSIFDFLPEHQHLKTNNREYITIEHLVTMTCGLAWDEWSVAHGSAANDIDMLYLDCEDPVSCVLERPWWAVPGEYFTYNGGGMVILAEIIHNATGMDIDEFSMKYLFEPLGINSTYWSRFANGMVDGAGLLEITPRDMIKFGVTYLYEGLWNGEQILSSDWVEKSSIIYRNNKGINVPGEDSGKNGYGYTWWLSEFEVSGEQIHMYRAGGWGGQEIMVFPDLNMVVVFTGGNYAQNTTLYKIIERYILPATV